MTPLTLATSHNIDTNLRAGLASWSPAINEINARRSAFTRSRANRFSRVRDPVASAPGILVATHSFTAFPRLFESNDAPRTVYIDRWNCTRLKTIALMECCRRGLDIVSSSSFSFSFFFFHADRESTWAFLTFYSVQQDRRLFNAMDMKIDWMIELYASFLVSLKWDASCIVPEFQVPEIVINCYKCIS